MEALNSPPSFIFSLAWECGHRFKERVPKLDVVSQIIFRGDKNAERCRSLGSGCADLCDHSPLHVRVLREAGRYTGWNTLLLIPFPTFWRVSVSQVNEGKVRRAGEASCPIHAAGFWLTNCVGAPLSPAVPQAG